MSSSCLWLMVVGGQAKGCSSTVLVYLSLQGWYDDSCACSSASPMPKH